MATHYRAHGNGSIRKTVSLSDDLVARLNDLAESRGLSFSHLVEKILTHYVEKRKP